MEIRGASWGVIEAAAMMAGVRLYNAREVGHTKAGEPKVKLRLKTGRDDVGRTLYGREERTPQGEPRRTPGGLVCWHGHRQFMRAVFTRAPEAVIITGVARYNGAEHFEATHGGTFYYNIGSQYRPLMMGEACGCDDVAGVYYYEPKHKSSRRKAEPLHSQGGGAFGVGGYGR